jgi:peptide/nickel transport system ATP-binding protein
MTTEWFPAANNGVALSVSGLSVGYAGRGRLGGTDVVSRVDFDVEAGETVALVGQSGSGKSTIALAATGLLPPNGRITEGSVRLNGTDVTGHSNRDWRRLRGRVLGFIPQDPLSSLDPLQPVGRQVGQVFLLHGQVRRADVKQRVIALLDRVGIREPSRCYDSYPHELSGGQLQRILIAIAIAANPMLLIADEPTSALDVTVQKVILDLIEDLQRELRLAVLFITHDLALAQERSHGIVVLNGGVVREAGRAATVMRAPRDPYTIQLLADAPALSPRKFTEVRQARLPPAPEPAIHVEALTKVYEAGGKNVALALDAVSFSVTRGAVHALVGESGSGKTTAARIIAGLTGFSAGTVRVGDRLLPTNPLATNPYAADLQLVYQNPLSAMDPKFTVRDIVEESLRIHRRADKSERLRVVRRVLDQVGLPAHVLDRRAKEISGGQRQRVAIARALVMSPGILVLDEPTSALDVSVQARLIELLVDLQAENGFTYLFISHDLGLVRQIADEITVLSAGRVVETGAVARIFDAPESEYTRTMLASMPGRDAWRGTACAFDQS